MTNAMIEAVGLHKSFGETHALRGLDFDVREGTILGMLGPNGAGKTTAVRILTTLTHPDSGSATVAGIDVLRQPAKARERIGVAGQYAALDELLTGRENLGMVGRLYRVDARTVRQRADALLERFELTDAADRTGQDILRRHAPAPRPRRRAHGRAPGRVPRRADHRPRPEGSTLDVGPHRRTRSRRHDGAHDDPVPRGGGPPGR